MTIPNLQAKVYIWNTHVADPSNLSQPSSNVGHTSLQLFKNGSKIDYLSLRPMHSWAVNPLTFCIPVRGINFEGLSKDILQERITPNREITIPLTPEQFRKIQQNISQQKTDIAAGNTRYHLFPKFSILPLIQFISSSTFFKGFTECQFSHRHVENIGQYPNYDRIKAIQSSHCALSVAKALSAGGIPVPSTGPAPWIITPTDLGNSLEKLNPGLD